MSADEFLTVAGLDAVLSGTADGCDWIGRGNAPRAPRRTTRAHPPL